MLMTVQKDDTIKYSIISGIFQDEVNHRLNKMSSFRYSKLFYRNKIKKFPNLIKSIYFILKQNIHHFVLFRQ